MARWPVGLLDLLCRDGLLVPAAPNSYFTCTQCDDPHTEEVIRIESPIDSTPRFYIQCPSVGRVRVDADDLKQWLLAPEAWARLAGRLLCINENFQTDIPERIWRLGVANLAVINREVLFVRGLAWSDRQQIESHIIKNGFSVPPALVVPRRIPMEKLIYQICFQEVIRFGDKGFILDRNMLDFIIASWPVVISVESKANSDDHFIISDDCRTAVLDGTQYSFTSRQAQVVELLWEAYQQKTVELSQERIIDRIGSESDTLTLRDVFRHSKAWNTLITPGSRRGMYRLNI